MGYELVRENKLAHGEAIYSLGQGYQFLLPGMDLAALEQVETMSGIEPESEKIGFCENAVEIQSPKKSDSGSGAMVENGQKRVQSPKKSDSGRKKTGSIMIDDDESINPNLETHHQSEPARNFPTLEVILENLPILFKGDLSLSEVPADTSPELALAWAAKLYKDFTRPGSDFRNPLGTMRNRLLAREKRKLHLEMLPDEYLVAIGLQQPRPVEMAVEALESGSDEDDQGEEIGADFEHAEIKRAWAALLGQLQLEMQRHIFESQVSETRPVGWQPETGLLTIAARTENAREWLEARLKSTVERMLPGVLGRGISVEFVVWRQA